MGTVRKLKRTTNHTVYQLEIRLCDAPLPVWRRILIDANAPLDLVHRIFQICMGWRDIYLHEFRAGGRRFSETHTTEDNPAVLDRGIFDAPPPLWRRILTDVNTPGDLVHKIFQICIGQGDSYLHDFTSRDRRFSDICTTEDNPAMLDETEFTLSDLLHSVGDTLEYEYDFGDGWSHQVVLERIERQKHAFLARCLDGGCACPPEGIGGVDGYARFLKAIEDAEHPKREELLTSVGCNFHPDSFEASDVNSLIISMEEALSAVALADVDI